MRMTLKTVKLAINLLGSRFNHLPGAVGQKERRQRWIRSCHRCDSFVCTKDSYVCSLRFTGENGPTEEDPDPISAVAEL